MQIKEEEVRQLISYHGRRLADSIYNSPIVASGGPSPDDLLENARQALYWAKVLKDGVMPTIGIP